ncbi:MAG: methylmalonyl Co-A mutase-associated GTPase MeaB [Owenweeksia sp.]|nr:methylmalonyl Co-A mutase-associated GTPase MeaB [Owenweeksia sp.]MBG00158.1 methylmalonyl Co-A mutase-associated GTPase MeaB [Owenweeksia sp.]HBF20588.1 methylmalonyl Co-A mutase-associated GTPase MeaB [Cryomorphaceae bacterium]
MDPINPRFTHFNRQQLPDPSQLLHKLIQGDRATLSRCLTLVESKKEEHRLIAEELIHQALPYSAKSLRIGITGVPGVGKSTFIEAFGEHLISKGHKVAVLAVDPSSTKSRGSILGDKTRMQELSQNESAFIRPSPSAGSLGGVARKTRESILLCEAAGYDVVLVETVGVGQSETTVKSMVDFFVLLMLAGAGDELQGIKRGIMEMADLLLINKADGENQQAVKRAIGEYKRALHLFPPNNNEWIPRVNSISALEKKGIDEAWEVMLEFERQQKTKGYFENNRKEQALQWFRDSLIVQLLEYIDRDENLKKSLEELEEMVKTHQLEPHLAVQRFLKKIWPADS